MEIIRLFVFDETRTKVIDEMTYICDSDSILDLKNTIVSTTTDPFVLKHNGNIFWTN
jgi:hypothetical protein